MLALREWSAKAWEHLKAEVQQEDKQQQVAVLLASKQKRNHWLAAKSCKLRNYKTTSSSSHLLLEIVQTC